MRRSSLSTAWSRIRPSRSGIIEGRAFYRESAAAAPGCVLSQREPRPAGDLTARGKMEHKDASAHGAPRPDFRGTSNEGENMNRRKFTTAMGAVVAGMVAGSKARAPKRRRPRPRRKADEKARPKHICKGHNECKGQGGCASDAAKHSCAGKNECKGMGGCKGGDNGCAGKNSCKGKGGCSVPVNSAHLGSRRKNACKGRSGPVASPGRGGSPSRLAPSRRRTSWQSFRPARPRGRRRPSHRPLRRTSSPRSPKWTGSRSSPRTSSTPAAGPSTCWTRSRSDTPSSCTACRCPSAAPTPSIATTSAS